MNPNQFNKFNRILKPDDFEALRLRSKKFANGTVVAYVRETEVGVGRLGISVSSKFANAVMRNQFKRVLREIFRHGQLKSISLDMLFVVQRGIINEKAPNIIIRKSFRIIEKRLLEEYARA